MPMLFKTRGSFEMPLFLSQRIVGPITILELGEQLKAQNIPEFRETLEPLIEQGRIHLLLDCSHIQKVDSMGIGSLVGHWISLKKRGGRLALLNPSARLREVLEVASLQGVIESFDDIGKVLQSE
jgi:anti-sigma B factor antagonist